MSTAIAVAIGLVAASVVAFGGLRARALTRSGAIAAAVVGTAIFGLGGLRWAAVMVGFFVLSSALSRVGRKRKRHAEAFVEKGSRRDAVQVLANGGVAALVAVLHGITPHAAFLFPAFIGSMAAATADTWSTEIGSLSRTPPRSILTGKMVTAGSSGGITPLGLLGALVGALAIGTIGGVGGPHSLSIIVIGTLAGLIGSLVDSLIGASVQRLYHCPRCMVSTERTLHTCGTPTVAIRGWVGVNNDTVNAVTTLFGAACAGLLFVLFR